MKAFIFGTSVIQWKPVFGHFDLRVALANKVRKVSSKVYRHTRMPLPVLIGSHIKKTFEIISMNGEAIELMHVPENAALGEPRLYSTKGLNTRGLRPGMKISIDGFRYGETTLQITVLRN